MKARENIIFINKKKGETGKDKPKGRGITTSSVTDDEKYTFLPAAKKKIREMKENIDNVPVSMSLYSREKSWFSNFNMKYLRRKLEEENISATASASGNGRFRDFIGDSDIFVAFACEEYKNFESVFREKLKSKDCREIFICVDEKIEKQVKCRLRKKRINPGNFFSKNRIIRFPDLLNGRMKKHVGGIRERKFMKQGRAGHER